LPKLISAVAVAAVQEGTLNRLSIWCIRVEAVVLGHGNGVSLVRRIDTVVEAVARSSISEVVEILAVPLHPLLIGWAEAIKELVVAKARVGVVVEGRLVIAGHDVTWVDTTTAPAKLAEALLSHL
jgi:hypothetical protein